MSNPDYPGTDPEPNQLPPTEPMPYTTPEPSPGSPTIEPSVPTEAPPLDVPDAPQG